MVGKILKIGDAVKLTKELNIKGRTIVLAGGCFDILHVGHIAYLANAKKQGDVLFALLESDENIKKLKTSNRPINRQEDRAKILSHLDIVDYIIKLPCFKTDEDYDKLVISLKPAIIATTKADNYIFHKKRQAKKIGAKVIDVTGIVKNQSTSKLVKLLKKLI